jgi:hypothetical protein
MEDPAHLDAGPDELRSRSLDVGDDQEQALGRPRLALRAEVDRALGARWGELDGAVVAVPEVGVEPPAEGSVERLCAVEIRDGQGDHLELEVDLSDARTGARVFAGDCGGTHGCLPGSVRLVRISVDPQTLLHGAALVPDVHVEGRARDGDPIDTPRPR